MARSEAWLMACLALTALGITDCGGSVVTAGEGDAGGSAGAPARSGSSNPAASAGLGGTDSPSQQGSSDGGSNPVAAGQGGVSQGSAGKGGSNPSSPGKGSAGKGGAINGSAGEGGAINGSAGEGGAINGSAGTGTAGKGGASVSDSGAAGANDGGASEGGTGAGSGSSASAGSGGSVHEVPLVPLDGWIDGSSNELAIQGAIFPAADNTSTLSLVSNFTGANSCISGTAALVDLSSVACGTPATDCYGEFWGALIGMYLNQPLDLSTTPPTVSTPLAFDASALQGFSFELSGPVLPAARNLRFQVESATTVFCSPPTTQLHVGINTVLFSDLRSECYSVTSPLTPTAVTARSALVKIAWQVVTNTVSTVPYDFCVSNIRAIGQ